MKDRTSAKDGTSAAPSVVSEERYSDTPEPLYRFLVDSLTEIAVFAVSSAGMILSWNTGAQKTFGYGPDEIVGRHFSLIFTPEDIESGAPANELTTALSGEQADHDRWHVRKDNTRFWATNTVAPMFDRAGALLGFTKLVRDITDSYLAREALSDSEQRLRVLIESVPEYAIFSVSLDGTIMSWNNGAQAAFGYDGDEIIGRSLAVLYTADDLAQDVPALALREATLHGHCSDERWLVRKDRTRFLASSKLSQLKRAPDGELRGFVKIAHDVTERKRIAEELRRRALSDQLTNLPNRMAFYEHVHRAIASIKRRSTNSFAVLFIDLDHFKTVNDAYGHIFADKVLEFTARRLEQCVRSGDIVARLGGDEFAILLNGINGVHDANDAVDRIGIEMSQPISIDDREVHVTASVGIALGSATYEIPADILADADTAMYVAKTSGRARSILFEPTMQMVSRQKHDLESDLRYALERDELRVEYQPIVELRNNSVVGFEALVRWSHPRRGLLQPHEFLPRAEQTDAIIPIDRWVLRLASKQLKEWQLQRVGTASLQMSVNFSRKQFSHPDLLDELQTMLAESGLESKYLRIEITESGVIERSERTSALLKAIRSLGFELQIDDFGIGYASLESLGHMPVGGLKIDRAFIAGMNVPGGAELVRSIVALAHNLGLVAVAEGVETAEQLKRLKRFDCDFGQGYYFSKPLDAAGAGEYLTLAGHALK